MPRGVYQRKQRKSKRDDILRAAGRIYAHHGFEGAKIELIAEAAGVSKSLVLEHFGNKQELIRAVADQAVSAMLGQVREIDGTPGMTLRQRELRIHDLIKSERDLWCVILGTVLVPNFEFQKREESMSFVPAACETVLKHSGEMREPTPQKARNYVVTAIGLHMAYIVGGNEADFQSAMQEHMDLYLKEQGELPC